MFNDYANHVPWSAYLEAFSEIKLPVVLPKAAFNLEAPRRHLADRRRANRPPCRGRGRNRPNALGLSTGASESTAGD
jgi:hypothetical protein